MTHIMQKEIESLKTQLLSLAAIVEESVQQSVHSLESRDLAMARKVIDGDEQVDRLEVQLEEECLKVLALHQPVAIDLRFLVVLLKINNDLERIADLAANIAERAIALVELPRIVPPFDLPEMALHAKKMLEMSLNSLVELDIDKTKKILAMDDHIDTMHAENFRHIKERILRKPDELDPLTQYLTVSRHLERIADLATNIAEDVYYMIEGEIVRHREEW